MRLPRALRVFWAGSVGMFLLTWLRGWLEARAGVPRNGWDPLDEPLFGDLLEYVPTLKLVHTSAFWGNPVTSPVAYPPFGAVLFRGLYLGGHPVAVYVVIAALAAGVVVWGVVRALRAEGIGWATAILFPVTVGLVSFPIRGLVERGNVELLLWIFAATGSWLYVRGRNDGAAVLWGLAAGVKLYPVIFLALLLPRRAWRAFGVGVGTFVGATVASMIYLGPTVGEAWRGSLKNVFGYQGIRVAEWSLHELVANHSFFGLVKFVATLMGVAPGRLTGPYYLCGAVLFAVVFFGRVWRLPVANQLLMVSLFMVMLPPISYFYTLVHLYAPFVVLMLVAVRAERLGVKVPGLGGALVLFVPVFGSAALMTARTVYVFGGLVQAVVLAVLFWCSVRYRFEVVDEG
ncbi:glycosyltransferase family 87 protein [Granulicella tundricola]|uniref:glycosyltransferase family 87 protein n=1 Tax=Granulicella tundricola TaxID=940615 RepID=UPI0012F8A9E6|nr:glycosyltransferase family 87 protein [Granulicella tundricola]